MTIFITGDSWSSDGWPDGFDLGYNVQNSLGSQLQRATSRSVRVLARPGDSDINQLNSLESRVDPSTPTVVVHGWSDWCRSIDFNWDNLNFTYGDASALRDYDSARTIAQQRLQEKILTLTKTYPNITWLHWGAQCAVWCDLPTHNHTVLYNYYANARCKCPVSDSGLETHARTTHFLNLFPWTPKDRRRTINHQIKRVIGFKFKHPKYFPDAGHLRWRLYDDLVHKIVEHL